MQFFSQLSSRLRGEISFVPHCGLLIGLLLFCFLRVSNGDGIDPKVKGILKIDVQENEAVGMEAFAPKGEYPFTDVSWYSASGGYLTCADGTQERFACNNVASIIYFDAEYYQRLGMQFDSFRSDIKPRESVVNIAFNEILTEKEFADVETSKTKLDQAGFARTKPYIDLLDGDIKNFNAGQRLINGKWVPRHRC